MKLFLRDNIGYIGVFIFSTLITVFYIFILGKVKVSECIYLIFLNTFILSMFLVIRYWRTRKLYIKLSKGLEKIEESNSDLGVSAIGESISELLAKQYNLYDSNLIEYNNKYNDHLTFINQWVHQMKTPLSVIQLQLHEYEGEEPIDSIKVEVDKVNKGLNMAMNFARIDSFQNDFIIKNVNLFDIVSKKVNEEKQLFIRNRIIPRINISKKLSIYTDEKWLKFILEQLIVNGIKYSIGYGKVLDIEGWEEEDKIKLVIKDEGIGIQSKDIKRIFEPFFTGENGRRFGESTGMGLYIVKRVCNELGHKIYVNSEINMGTSILIEFRINSIIT
ncbi:sensor histidine kinase [Clostridium paraputrificum]|uniref:sensor histidine kinase n=1 Tax=Clostridium paraputrificum TaxID=29363 RepID=UPI003D32EB6E